MPGGGGSIGRVPFPRGPGRAFALVAMGALVLSGCSLGAKQALADRVSRSVKSATRAGSAIGTMTLSLYVVRSSLGSSAHVPPVNVGPIPMAIDFSADRAEVGADPTTPGAIPTVVFSGTTMYQRKVAGAGSISGFGSLASTAVASMFHGNIGILSLQPPGQSGASALGAEGGQQLKAAAGKLLAGLHTSGTKGAKATGAKATGATSTGATSTSSTTSTTAANPVTGSAALTGSSSANLGPGSQQWFQYSFDTLPPSSVPVSAGALGVNPVTLVRLLDGALAGSIRDRGAAKVGGVDTTRYVVNLDPSQMVSDLPSRQQDDFTKQLEANGISTDGIVPSEVWLDARGLPRRIALVIPQIIDRGDSDALVVTMNLSSYGSPIAIGLPSIDEVAQVQSFGQLISTVSAS